MIVRRLLPAGATAESVDLDDALAPDSLEALYALPAKPWLRSNLVTGVDGGAQGADGISDGLSSLVDRRILGAIRRLADIVLVGAATVRAEGFRVPAVATLAVVTASGDLGSGVLDQVSAGRVTVYCPLDRRERVRARLTGVPVGIVGLPASDGRIDVALLVAELHAAGASSIVCEGGPSLVGQLLDAGLVDEVCSTVSPLLTGGAPPMFAGRGGGTELTLAQLLSDDDGRLYARWRVTRGAASSATP